jgi:hypothetical protein
MTNSSEEQYNEKILEVMAKMELVKGESLETLDLLRDVNDVVLGAGADVLSALGQEELAAAITKKESGDDRSYYDGN